MQTPSVFFQLQTSKLMFQLKFQICFKTVHPRCWIVTHLLTCLRVIVAAACCLLQQLHGQKYRPSYKRSLVVFLNCSTDSQGPDGEGHHKTTNRGSQNSNQGCMRSVTARNMARGHTSKFPRSKQSQTTMKKSPRGAGQQ